MVLPACLTGAKHPHAPEQARTAQCGSQAPSRPQHHRRKSPQAPHAWPRSMPNVENRPESLPAANHQKSCHMHARRPTIYATTLQLPTLAPWFWVSAARLHAQPIMSLITHQTHRELQIEGENCSSSSIATSVPAMSVDRHAQSLYPYTALDTPGYHWCTHPGRQSSQRQPPGIKLQAHPYLHARS